MDLLNAMLSKPYQRAYVLSDSQYTEMLRANVRQKIHEVEQTISYYEKRLVNLGKELERLKQECDET